MIRSQGKLGAPEASGVAPGTTISGGDGNSRRRNWVWEVYFVAGPLDPDPPPWGGETSVLPSFGGLGEPTSLHWPPAPIRRVETGDA